MIDILDTLGAIMALGGVIVIPIVSLLLLSLVPVLMPVAQLICILCGALYIWNFIRAMSL